MANFFSADYWKALYFKAMGGQETAVDPNAMSGSFAGSSSWTGALENGAAAVEQEEDGSPAHRVRPEDIRRYREQREKAERELKRYADELAGFKAPEPAAARKTEAPDAPTTSPLVSPVWTPPTVTIPPRRVVRAEPVATPDLAAIKAAEAAQRAMALLRAEIAQLAEMEAIAEAEAARQREEDEIILLLLAA